MAKRVLKTECVKFKFTENALLKHLNSLLTGAVLPVRFVFNKIFWCHKQEVVTSLVNRWMDHHQVSCKSSSTVLLYKT